MKVSLSRFGSVLVGRDHELQVLERRLDLALGDSGGLVLLAGEPGIGKTSLAGAAAALATAHGMTVAWGSGIETEGAPAYWPWREVLVTVAREALGEPSPGLEPSLEVVARIAPDVLPSAPLDRADPQDAGERFLLFTAVARVLAAAATTGGLLVVLDDLHWADPPSILLLREVSRGLGASRIVALASYRDTAIHPGHPLRAVLPDLLRAQGAELVVLRGLSKSSVAAQLEQVAGRPLASEVSELVHDRTAGNPFFVAEVGRLLADPEDERADVARAAAVPAAVHEVVRHRAAALSHETARALAVASLVGREFDAVVVAAATGRPLAAMLAALDQAIAAQLVRRTPGRAASYRFVHDLVREALGEQLAAADRLELHATIARQLETAGHGAGRAAQIAHHWVQAAPGGHADRAAGAAEAAGDAALRSYAYEEAARWYGVALEVSTATCDSPEDRCRRGLRRAEALYAAGEITDALGACREVADVAEATGDGALVAAAALVVEGVGDPRTAPTVVALCDRALRALPDDDLGLRSRVLAQSSVAAIYTGQAERAEVAGREALRLAERDGGAPATVAALRALVQAARGPAAVEDRLRHGERMLALAEAAGQPTVDLWGRLWRNDSLVQLGRLDDARREVAQIGADAELVPWPLGRWHAARARAGLAFVEGRFEDAARYGRDAQALASSGHPAAGSNSDAFVVILAAYTGSDAAAEAERLRRAASEGGVFAAMFHGFLGLWHASRDELGEALEQLRRLPPASWQPPAFLALAYACLRVDLAAELGDPAAVSGLGVVLDPYAHLFCGGLGMMASWGSAQLFLGRLAHLEGRHDDAVARLEAARRVNADAGAAPFEARATYELAHVLVARGHPADRSRAAQLVASARDQANALGMAPLALRSDRLAALLRTGGAGPLTAREYEVARLVARGLTNRGIAEALHISERTAENHVQHMLTKLGFGSRSQIAAWIGAADVSRGVSTRK